MKVNLRRPAELYGKKYEAGINEVPEFMLETLKAGGYIIEERKKVESTKKVETKKIFKSKK